MIKKHSLFNFLSLPVRQVYNKMDAQNMYILYYIIQIYG